MATRSVARHTPRDLVFTRRTGDILYFAASSASQPGRTNTVAYDWATGEAHCDCRAAEVGRECWHVQHVAAAAWALAGERVVARWGQTDAALFAIGLIARRRVVTATAGGLWPEIACPLDWAVLIAARAAYRRRAARNTARCTWYCPPCRDALVNEAAALWLAAA